MPWFGASVWFALVFCVEPPAVEPIELRLRPGGQPPRVAIDELDLRARRRRGIIALAAVPFAGAIALQAVTEFVVRSECQRAGDDEEPFDPIGECGAAQVISWPSKTYGAVLLAATVGAAGATAGDAGRWAAAADVAAGRPILRRRGMVRAGAALVGVSGAALVASNVALMIRQNACRSFECETQARVRRLIATDLGVAGLGAGAALLAYALVYRRSAAKRRNLRLDAQVGPGYGGLTLSGRF